MQATTLRINKATYTNGRYYVHGWKNDRGTFTVVATKRGQFRRSPQTWIANATCASYEEATQVFNQFRDEIDAIVSRAEAKRGKSSADRMAAVAAYKSSTPNPWKVGDMCHTSWGYDQTNVDAFQVVEVWSRTQIFVRPIGGDVVDTGYMQGKFTPKQNQFTGQAIKVTAGFHFYKHSNSVSESWSLKGHNLFETKPGQSHHFSSYA